jgi:PAS domain S-box-containing protein
MNLPMKNGGAWLTAALTYVREGVICIDRTGEVLWMNPAAEKLTGWREKLARGRQADAIFESFGEASSRLIGARVQTVLKEGTVRHTPISFGRGSDVMDVTITPAFESSECRGVVVVLFEPTTGRDPDSYIHPVTSRKTPRDHQDRTPRVLVMDDDDVVLNLTIQKLIRLGYTSEGASNGEEAVTKFKEARDKGQPFDVVVLDLIVRGGMGGKEAIEMLRTIDPHVKAVLTSGHAMDRVLTNFWEYGFFGVVRKPFVIKELEVAIRQALEDA